MYRKRLNTLYATAGAIAGLAALSVPASVGSAADMIAAPTLSYELDGLGNSTAPTAELTPAVATVDLGAPDEPAFQEDDDMVADADDASLVCMAKVVLHEAGNQPRSGKVAVAQTLVNRLRDGRFGGSICGVANQPGQYFNLSRFNPRRDSDAWADAMDVAGDVLRGEPDAVAPGAMFFRANYAPANSFFRGRKRVAEVGAHVFYR
jgi:N-acetylmuramoyl-L-alanine amidase